MCMQASITEMLIWTPTRDTDWLMSLRTQTSVSIAYVGVPTPASLTAEDRQNVKALNLNARMAEARSS